jgi:hypothetical protein
MTALLDKLNLRPNERRLVVIVAVVVAAFLYYFLVWPQFGEWNKLRKKRADAELNLNRFAKEIARIPEYQKELEALQRKGARVETAAQDIDLQRNVYSIAAASGVNPGAYTASKAPSSGGKTNAWFEEQAGSIQFVAVETNLVDFLCALSSGDSLIRVSSMTLSPDQPRQRLLATMTLVASYPRKAPPKIPGPASPVAAAPAAKPAALAGGPKSIPAAVSGTAAAAANPARPPGSLWGKVKNLFRSGKSTNPPAKTAGPAKGTAPTNAPVRWSMPAGRAMPTNAPPIKK